MDVVAGYEDRAHARMDERVLTEEMPGPLNNEPWAGAKQAVLALDPTPVGMAMELGEEAGKAITPWAEKQKAKRKVWADYWLSEE